MENISYGRLGARHTQRILDVYAARRSCERTSRHPDVAAGSATVSRVVRWAVERGYLTEDIRPNGRPRVDTQRIRQVCEDFPHLTREQQAQRAGVSVTALYRTLRKA